MSSKDPLFHPSERVDLEDFDYGIRQFPRNIQSDLIRSLIGAGVFDGFRVEVLSQSGSTVGHLNISNGFGGDWAGRFINAQSGTNSQRVVLGAPNTEYWIEIELTGISSDPDSRAFWDSSVDNTDPIPDGQEINIAGVFTRNTPFWQIKQPIRNNTVGTRGSVGYNPARFSPNSSLSIPLAVIRTDSNGKILAGDPSTDASGNDIITVTVEGGATIDVIKQMGYGEGTVAGKVQGRKSSDQRPRLYERLEPPFLGGAANEVLGDSTSDHWARDEKSAYDHLATQIAQMKHGSNDSSIGDFYGGTLDAFDPAYEYVDISNLILGVTGGQVVDPDDLIGTTFQIFDGHWAGYYAQVMGNGATVGDVTRCYLKKQSSIPEWKRLPQAGAYVRIVKHRMVNWASSPTPASSGRGYDDLDSEVVSSRVDYHSYQTFDNLKARINANKYATVTFSPVDTKDGNTGEPTLPTTPRSDYYTSLTDIRNAFSQVAGSRGGVIKFRRGIYDFAGIAPATTVFTMANSTGFTIEGDGVDSTTLQFDTGSGTTHLLFALSSCTDITFKDLTIKGRGKIFSASGCSRLKFKNCNFEGVFEDLSTATLDFGSGTEFEFDNCQMTVAGAGVQFTGFSRAKMAHCLVTGIDTGAGLSAGTDLTTLINFGSLNRAHIHNNRFKGYAAGGCLVSSAMNRTQFHDNILETYTLAAGASGRFYISGSTYDSQIHNNFFGTDGLTPGLETPVSFRSATFNSSRFENNRIEQSVGGVSLVNSTGSYICNNKMDLLSEGSGVIVGPLTDSYIMNNNIKIAASTPGAGGIGIEFSTGARSYISKNTIEAVSGVLWKGISFTSTLCENVQMDENIISGCEKCISIESVQSALRLSVCKNQVLSTTNEGIFLKMGGANSQYIMVCGNSVQAQGVYGIRIDVNLGNVRDSSFSDNMIRDAASVSRSLYFSGSVGTDVFESCKILNNSMTGPMEIAVKMNGCHISGNTARTLNTSACVLSSELEDCDFSHNIFNCTNEHGVRFAYFAHCRIIGNKVTVTGTDSCGFYWEAIGTPKFDQNVLRDNYVSNTDNPVIPVGTPWTGGDDWTLFGMGFMLYSVRDTNSSGTFATFNSITNNTSSGFAVGFFMIKATKNHVSGNRCVMAGRPTLSSVTLGFVLSDRQDESLAAQEGVANIGGHIDGNFAALSMGSPGNFKETGAIGVPPSDGIVVPAWLGDRTEVGITQAFKNVLWPWNTEVNP